MEIGKIDALTQATTSRTAAIGQSATGGVSANAPTGVVAEQAGVSQQPGEPSTEQRKDLDKGAVKEVSKALNHFMALMNADLEFSVHEKTHRIMVKLVDVKTKEVLREFPPKEFLDMVARIQEFVGNIIDKKA